MSPFVRPGSTVQTVHTRGPLASASHALAEERRQLTDRELAALAGLPSDQVPALAALAHEVRLAWCGPGVEVEGILSVKTAGCPEDCSFCSQSSRFESPVKATPFLDADEILAAAEETARLGASEFCLVAAVRGPDERMMGQVLDVVPRIRERTGLNVACSLGILDRDQGAGEMTAAYGHPPAIPVANPF